MIQEEEEMVSSFRRMVISTPLQGLENRLHALLFQYLVEEIGIEILSGAGCHIIGMAFAEFILDSTGVPS